MAELSLQSWNEGPRGWSSHGYAGGVPISVSSPEPRLDGESPKIIYFNGLGSDRESMAVAAGEATRRVYTAIRFSYTNTKKISKPVERNADDALRVVDTLDVNSSVSLLGLSMGGAVATEAASRSSRLIESLHLVAPAGFTDDIDKLTMQDVVAALNGEYLDITQAYINNPALFGLIACDSLASRMRRQRAISAEFEELRHTSSYGALREFRQAQPDSIVTLAYGSHDKLVRPGPLLASVGKEETAARADKRKPPIDRYISYDGPHRALIFDRRVMNAILDECWYRLAA